MSVAHGTLEKAKSRALDAAGGPARLQVIALLASVLALDSADKGTLSAVSTQIKQAFAIDNTSFGVLLAVVSFAGALGTIPIGVLADRMRRKTILLVAIGAWTAAMVLSGTATSYLYLLLTRLLLGAVTAAAWPCVASLTGDFFPARSRARLYGLILSGELVGLGIGFFVAGEISSWLGWRWSFYLIAALSLIVLWAIWRYLPEPARGAQSWLGREDTDPAAASRPHRRSQDEDSAQTPDKARQIAREQEVKPREKLILHEDPTRRGWIWALGYCLSIPSYRLLVIASALAYWFFSGVRTFGIIYFVGHYHVPHAIAIALVIVVGAGALAGVVGGGRLSEWLLARGRLDTRIVLPGVALIVSVPFIAFGIWTSSVWLGFLLITLGAVSLSAAVPPIDAARLDIVHPRLWGRAEAGRMALRSTFEGGAPILFGAMSGWLGGGTQGLMWTLLLMLLPMAAASLIALPGRREYPRDVATAAASVDAISAAQKDEGKPSDRKA